MAMALQMYLVSFISLDDTVGVCEKWNAFLLRVLVRLNHAWLFRPVTNQLLLNPHSGMCCLHSRIRKTLHVIWQLNLVFVLKNDRQILAS